MVRSVVAVWCESSEAMSELASASTDIATAVEEAGAAARAAPLGLELLSMDLLQLIAEALLGATAASELSSSLESGIDK